MPEHIRTWVVVADSARARLFTPDEDETKLIPKEFAGLADVNVARHARDVMSDRPTRSFSSAGGGVRHAVEPRQDPHKQEKHKFAAGLASALDQAYRSKEYDRLILLVPARTLGELRTLLSTSVQACMEVVAKDLTKATAQTIWSQIATIVRHRATKPAP